MREKNEAIVDEGFRERERERAVAWLSLWGGIQWYCKQHGNVWGCIFVFINCTLFMEQRGTAHVDGSENDCRLNVSDALHEH